VNEGKADAVLLDRRTALLEQGGYPGKEDPEQIEAHVEQDPEQYGRQQAVVGKQ